MPLEVYECEEDYDGRKTTSSKRDGIVTGSFPSPEPSCCT